MNFHPVRVRGHFDYDNEVYIVNQNKRLGIEALESAWFVYYTLNTPFTYDDEALFKRDPGHWVVTPFILSDGKTRILVNRGWVPLDQKDPATRASGQVRGEVELTGLVRTLNQKRTIWKDFRNDPDSGNYTYRGIGRMARNLKTLPVWIDLDRETTDKFPGSPIGGQTSLEYFNDYELQSYYCLFSAIGSSLIWYFKFVGPVRHKMFPNAF